MKTEIEEKILDINKDEIIKKLEELGAKKVGEWLQKRYVYDFVPKRDKEWIRLRTNGIETTLTYKNIESNTITGTKELEIVVSDFAATNALLNVLGYKSRTYQENYRIRYYLDNVEIDIDTWPLIPSYLELEGNSVEEVKKIEGLLNIDKNNITNLSCEEIYLEKYGIDIVPMPELKFIEENKDN